MKKQILTAVAFASMACLAQAQSSVTLTGTMDAGVGSIRMAGDHAATTSVVSGGMTTPWFGVAGTEDLGGGLKASFALDGFFNNGNGTSGRFTGDTLFSRDANVSLGGGFGTVTLGRGLAPNFLPTIIFNPFGDSFTYSPLVLHANVPLFNGTGWSATTPSDTGWNNEVIYSTPHMGGLSANFHYQLGGISGQSSKTNIGANVLYFSGPLALTAFVEQDQLSNPGNSTAYSNTKNDWMVGGSYDLKTVKLYATTGSAKASGSSISTTTSSVGASVPCGSGSFLADYASTKVDAGHTRQTATVGYDYTLSKRTDVYANYMNDKITSYTAGNSYGIGIRHKF